MTMHWVYYFGRGLIRSLMFLFSRWQIKGRENVPEQGPLLIVCNHLHLADPPIVAASIKLKAVFMAKEELWQNSWSRFWVENFGAFPIRRKNMDREAFRQAEKWLNRGVSLIMFPEGSRSHNASMQPALAGAALIALRYSVPILPVSITGTEKFRDFKRCLRHRPTVTVTIGVPFNPPAASSKSTKDQRQQLMNKIMGKIAGLLPAEYRGIYAEGENDAEDRKSQ